MKFLALSQGAATLDVRIAADRYGPASVLDSHIPSTVLLTQARLISLIAPVPIEDDIYSHWPSDISRAELTFESGGADRGDLLGDIERALYRTALIHSCPDFQSPKSCEACSLLHRVRSLRLNPN